MDHRDEQGIELFHSSFEHREWRGVAAECRCSVTRRQRRPPCKSGSIDHDQTVWFERGANMFQVADRIAHVMEAIEHRDEIVFPRQIFRFPGLEGNVRHLVFLRMLACFLDGLLMEVKAQHFGFWQCLGHDHRGDAVTTSHVGELATLLEFSHDPLRAGNQDCTRWLS
jgi:hypothetical protein